MKRIKPWRIVSLILLILAIMASIDLGLNLLAAMIPSMNDGIGCWSTVYLLLHGDKNWSLEAYWQSFRNSCWLSVFIFVENIVLYFIEYCKKKREDLC